MKDYQLVQQCQKYEISQQNHYNNSKDDAPPCPALPTIHITINPNAEE